MCCICNSTAFGSKMLNDPRNDDKTIPDRTIQCGSKWKNIPVPRTTALDNKTLRQNAAILISKKLVLINDMESTHFSLSYHLLPWPFCRRSFIE